MLCDEANKKVMVLKENKNKTRLRNRFNMRE